MYVDIESLKDEIIERLKPLNPDKIILFGSYAYGKPNEDSDIDLYIVTKEDFIPGSFKEKSKIYLLVARELRDILEKYPTDLIIHTKAMHQKFKELNSSFAKEILSKGVSLL